MLIPTRDDLCRLLWSDPASEAFEADARSELEGAETLTERIDNVRELLDRVIELFRVIASEVDVEMFIEDAEDDARDLARTGMRLAILALYAAWFAQQHADKLHATKTAEKGARLVEGENT